jgi:selenide, water dikinase
MNKTSETIKLTAYSHGAGCGCKIAPKVLDTILKGNIALPNDQNLIVGNHSKDDAAVYNLGQGMGLISTTDFFMPIVDDPFTFGKIAACNAISDVYAMGGQPVLALAILGWPIAQLAPEIAQQVIDGGRAACLEAGISLAGGHSIDAPEPIFGLAVNGLVQLDHLKKNNTAQAGDLLYITKALGIGILTTAEKKGILDNTNEHLAANQMMQLNTIGHTFGTLTYVHAMTDVTGFGLLGHLCEMAEGSGLSANIDFEKIPLIHPEIYNYIKKGSVPGGTLRNWNSYGHNISTISDLQMSILADPQTSGGLMVAIDPAHRENFENILIDKGFAAFAHPIGTITAQSNVVVSVN